MARPIKNTPELYGKDARRFNAEAFVMPPLEDRMRERERVRKSVSKLMALAGKMK